MNKSIMNNRPEPTLGPYNDHIYKPDPVIVTAVLIAAVVVAALGIYVAIVLYRAPADVCEPRACGFAAAGFLLTALTGATVLLGYAVKEMVGR